MRIPLIIGATPSNFNGGSLVPLAAGKWKVSREGSDGLNFLLETDHEFEWVEPDILEVKENTRIRVKSLEGSGEFLNLYLEAA